MSDPTLAAFHTRDFTQADTQGTCMRSARVPADGTEGVFYAVIVDGIESWAIEGALWDLLGDP